MKASASKIKPQFRFAISSLLLVFAAATLHAVTEPQHLPGRALFRLRYATSQNKWAFLQSYQRNLRDYNGAYLPEEIDRFLCKRLASSEEEEAWAVTRFYVSKAQGREGEQIVKLAPPTQQRTIQLIFRNLEQFPANDLERALFLVEEIRRGEIIWKGRFNAPHKSWNSMWWQREGLPQVKRCYIKWWNSKLLWAEKRKVNPLAGSGFEAIEL